MCKELPDHEIQADEMADYIEWRKQYHEPIGDEFDAPEHDVGPQPKEFTDAELEDMNRVWQESMRGCVGQWNPPALPSIDDIIRHNRGL